MHTEAPILRGAAKRAHEAKQATRPYALACIALGLLFAPLPGMAVVAGVFDQLGLYGSIGCIGSALACFAGAMALRRV